LAAAQRRPTVPASRIASQFLETTSREGAVKKLVVILTTALILLGGAAIHFWRHLDASRQQTADLQAQLEAMKAARQAAEASFAAQLKAAMNRPAAAAAAAIATPAAPPPANPAQVVARAEGLATALREQMASPEAQARTRATRRALMVQQYPDIGKELNLSEQEVSKFFDLLAQQETNLAADVLGGGPTDPASLQARMAKRQADQLANEAELKTTLGSKYPQWQEYKETLPTRRQVTDLRAVLSASGSSLSDAQARPLITALAAEQKRIEQEARESAMSGNRPALPMLQQYSPENTKRVVDAAAPYLNPQQLESFRQMREREANSRRAMQSQLEAAMEQARTRGAAPP
jgi:hypothetical protein